MIKDLRLQTQKNQKEFAEYLNIPIRTIQDWEHEKRTPPSYVVELIEYKLKKENLIKKENNTMKVLIIETSEIKELSNVITQFDDLGQNIERTEEYNEEYEATMSLDCYKWWDLVAKGIEIAEEKELDTTDFEYDDYIALV